ncbi:uncharacterized protein LOC62_01G001624 [Vanrija pseudolonga]|uniref:F-box domain-containing protein n=1 Tax=Vanrija pseudolonga TaxID=143232 RepID=A0AAF1BFH7_9TREE|nr:hypothetical protein LOC62_01G001624 [Vanrija pseudolonga]
MPAASATGLGDRQFAAMKFSLSQLFRCAKPLKDAIAEGLLGCPHTIAMVLSYADTATLVTCLRVSREFHHMAGKSLYHTITVRAGQEHRLLCGVERAVTTNFKTRLLANVRVLTLVGFPSMCEPHCMRRHTPFFPNLDTLRIVHLPSWHPPNHRCSLLQGVAPRKAVIRNMDGLHMNLRVHETRWSTARLDTLVIMLPTHGWLLQSPGRLLTGFEKVPRVKVVFWPLVRPAEVMPTTVNPALSRSRCEMGKLTQVIPSLRDLVIGRPDMQVTLYGLETLLLGEGSRFAAAVRQAYPPNTVLTQALLQEHVQAEISAACDGDGVAAVRFRTRDEYVADVDARGGELKAEDWARR